MNTPRKKRRFDGFPGLRFDLPAGLYSDGLSNPEAARLLGMIVTEFTHLETRMKHLFGSLAGLDDPRTAAYILDSIFAVSSRIDIMRNLLEMAPRNAEAADEYDWILTEFREVNSLRNQYVHGEWFEHQESGEIRLARPRENPHDIPLLSATSFDPTELDGLLERIRNLQDRIIHLAA